MELRIISGKFLRLPPELREQFRAEFDKIRDEFEMRNLGSFEKIYPLPNDQAFEAKSKEYL